MITAMKTDKRHKINFALQCIVLLLCLMACIYGYVMWQYTLSSWWYPALIALVLALVSAPIWVRSKKAMFWHMAVAGSLCYMAFLGVNSWCADSSKSVTESAEVVDKFSEKHNDYRRVGRHRYIPNGSHYTYHVTLRLESGETRNFEVTLAEYNRLRKGSKRKVTRNEGFFGMPFVKL